MVGRGRMSVMWGPMMRRWRVVMLPSMMRRRVSIVRWRRSMMRWWMMSCMVWRRRMSFMVRRRGMSRRPMIESTHDSIPVRTQAPDETCTFHLFNSCLDT